MTASGRTRQIAELAVELDDIERKAWDALGRYKFYAFGHYCAIWVHLNRVGHFKRANPWKAVVLAAAPRAGVVESTFWQERYMAVGEPIEELRAKVLAATEGEWFISPLGDSVRAERARPIHDTQYVTLAECTNMSLGDPLPDNANAALIVAAVNLAKHLCTDKGVETVARAIAKAKRAPNLRDDATIDRVWVGYCGQARAAIRAILGEGTSTLGVGVETRDG
jgi:hypothetical protein